jgi:phage-related protein
MPVAYTFTPPYHPDFGNQRQKKAMVLKAMFGDGYQQRAGDGLNNRPTTLNLTWTNLSDTDAATITDFFAARKGYQSFWYTYQDDIQRAYICETYETQNVDPFNYVVTAQFREVFDVS